MFVVPIARRSAAYVHPFDRVFKDRLERACASASNAASTAANTASSARTPALDVIDNDISYVAVLDIPGVRETVDIDHIKRGYYSIKSLNPNGIVPKGPDLPGLAPVATKGNN